MTKLLSKIFSICLTPLLITSLSKGAVYTVFNISELNSAVSKVVPGDTIMMKNGVWQNAKIIFSGNGTADKPIYLLAQTPGSVLLNGTSTLRIAGNYVVVKGLYFKGGYSSSGDVIEFRNGSSKLSNYCRLTDCAIVDYNPSDVNTDYKWVSLYGSHNRVDHCFFRGKTNLGTTLVVWLSAQPNYHEIDSNYFAQRPSLNGLNGAETIRVGTSDWSMYDSFTTVESNYFEHCSGEIEIISNKSCGNVYLNNTFYECEGTLTLRHGNRCTVEGNYFIGNNKSNTGGVRIIGEQHKVYNNYFYQLTGSDFRSALSIVDGIPNSPLNGYFQVKNAEASFNTFVDNKHSITIGAGKSSTQNMPPKNCIIADNIVKSSYSPLVLYTDTPDSLTWKGNIFYGASLGISLPDENKITDPKLIFSTDSLWRPSSTSPALDSAKGLFQYVENDIDGQPRDSIKDIGCDQLSSRPVVRKRIGPADVGLDWQFVIDNLNSNHADQTPKKFGLLQNYPNPFNPGTKIRYDLDRSGNVKLEIVNVIGKIVARLVDQLESLGHHEVSFNGSQYPSGIYFCRLQSGEKISTIKMVMLK